MNEAFDKWLWNYDNGGLHCYDDCKAAFKAGMLRAAEIADDTEEGCGYGCPNIIVATIRKEAEDEHNNN